MNALNRKIQPAIIPVTLSVMNEVESWILENKIPVYIIDAGEEELVRMDFIFNAGQVYEKVPLLSSTTNMMLTEGSKNFTAEKLNKALDYFGAVSNLFAEKDSAGLSIAFLTKYTERILNLCIEILFRPEFPSDELEALMRKRLQWFYVNREKVQNIASDKFFESAFGNSHPYGRAIKADDFRQMNPGILAEFHSEFYSPENLTIILSGKIHPEMKILLNDTIGRVSRRSSDQIEPDDKPSPGRTGKVFEEKKDAVQSAIRIGSMTINKKHPDYPGLKITDTILGGYFGSRLMKNIREDKGYTYDISSSVASYKLSAYKVISTEVGIKHTQSTIVEIYREIKRLQSEPVENDEFEIVRNYMLGEMLRMFDGPFATADSFRSVWEFGLDYSYYSRLATTIKTIDADEIIHLAKTYYRIEDMFEVVVGPE